ncbi:hypothetical protein ENBRE01_2859 [Enteropsectra breve]|nr:hypothetical protein ENBRE01_2859 [Enteropsectra breve]
MKKITIAQLKDDSFNALALIESAIELNPSSLQTSLHHLRAILLDLESSDEALFFKIEKLKHKLREYTKEKYVDIGNKIQLYMNHLTLEPLGDSRIILERNKKILEFKAMQKYLRYACELEKNPEPVLKSLLGSEMSHDWIFLSELLHYSIRFSKTINKEILLIYSKKTEEKMMQIFTKGIKDSKTSSCKVAFQALTNLEKETVLVDQYIFSKNFSSLEISIRPPLINAVNLDNLELPHNQFDEFIDKLMKKLDPSTFDYTSIFGNTPKYQDYFNNKIYRTLIFRNIEGFLDVQTPVIFLMSLSSVYKKLVTFGDFIKEQYSRFASEVYISEGLGQYFPKAIQKEKQLFDEIVEMMLYNKECTIEYSLLDEKLKYDPDYVRSYEKMLCLVDLMQMRAALFYSADEEKELIQYFFRKATSLVERLITQVDNEMVLIGKLSHIFLLTQRYFDSHQMHNISEFVDFLNTTIQKLFNRKIESYSSEIKHKIHNLYFLKEKGYRIILEYMKDAANEGQCMTGKNHQTYLNRIIATTLERLSKQIFSIAYSKEQGKILLCCLDDFIGYTSFLNNIVFLRKFSHLKEICMLITVQQEMFLTTYKEFKNSISSKELHDLLKCRKDKDAVKKLLQNQIQK